MPTDLPLHGLLPRPAWWFGADQQAIDAVTDRMGKVFARHGDAVARCRNALRASVDPHEAIAEIHNLAGLAETPEQDAAVSRLLRLAGDAAITAMARWRDERDDLFERHLPLRKDGTPRTSTSDAFNAMHPQSLLAGCVPNPDFSWLEEIKVSRSALAMAALYFHPLVGDRSAVGCAPEMAHLCAALEADDKNYTLDNAVGSVEARLISKYGPHLRMLLTTTDPATAYHAGSVADWLAAQQGVLRACGLSVWAQLQAIHAGRSSMSAVEGLRGNPRVKLAAWTLMCDALVEIGCEAEA
jgi:hypothetical protein